MLWAPHLWVCVVTQRSHRGRGGSSSRSCVHIPFNGPVMRWLILPMGTARIVSTTAQKLHGIGISCVYVGFAINASIVGRTEVLRTTNAVWPLLHKRTHEHTHKKHHICMYDLSPYQCITSSSSPSSLCSALRETPWCETHKFPCVCVRWPDRASRNTSLSLKSHHHFARTRTCARPVMVTYSACIRIVHAHYCCYYYYCLHMSTIYDVMFGSYYRSTSQREREWRAVVGIFVQFHSVFVFWDLWWLVRWSETPEPHNVGWRFCGPHPPATRSARLVVRLLFLAVLEVAVINAVEDAGAVSDVCWRPHPYSSGDSIDCCCSVMNSPPQWFMRI